MIYLNSDNLVALSGLYNDGYINDATVTARLVDQLTGVELYSYTLNYLADTNGNYSGLIPESIASDLYEDQELWHEITIVSGDYQMFVKENDIAGFMNLGD